MKTIVRKIILLVGLVALAGPALAQYNKEEKGFDATDKAFQRRYRYPDEVPFDTLWKNNISITAFGGMDQFVPRGKGDFNTGSTIGMGLNWRFARFHSLRGTIQYGSFGRKIDNETLRRLGIQADYLLNITSYMKGYNPGRLFEVSAVGGVGFQLASFLKKTQGVTDLHLGMQLKLHPNPHLDFYFEPRVSFLTDGIDHSDQQNWHKYDVLYGAVVGVNYHMKGWKPLSTIQLLDGDKILDNTFISISSGGQFQISKLTNELGISKALGPHINFSVGKWLIPSFGLRMSLFSSADTWHSKKLKSEETNETEGPEEMEGTEDTIYEMSTYNGFRLEGMLNLTHYYNKTKEMPRFTIHALAGGEIGRIKKENGYTPAKGGYTGLTTGLQFKYRLWDDMSVFLEPRISFASFTLKTNKKIEGRYEAKKFTDNLFSLNLGIELGRANEERRLESEIYSEEFEPSLFIGGGLGMAMPLQMKRFRLKNYLNYEMMALAGYVMTPLSTVRVSVDYGPYTIDMKTAGLKYSMATVGADYLLNLGNLMMGYNPTRKYDVQLLAGLVGSMRMNPSREVDDEDLNKSKIFLGLETGLHLSYEIMDNLKLFLEPKIRYYSQNLTKQSSQQGYDRMLMFHVGSTYFF